MQVKVAGEVKKTLDEAAGDQIFSVHVISNLGMADHFSSSLHALIKVNEKRF